MPKPRPPVETLDTDAPVRQRVGVDRVEPHAADALDVRPARARAATLPQPEPVRVEQPKPQKLSAYPQPIGPIPSLNTPAFKPTKTKPNPLTEIVGVITCCERSIQAGDLPLERLAIEFDSSSTRTLVELELHTFTDLIAGDFVNADLLAKLRAQAVSTSISHEQQIVDVTSWGDTYKTWAPAGGTPQKWNGGTWGAFDLGGSATLSYGGTVAWSGYVSSLSVEPGEGE